MTDQATTRQAEITPPAQDANSIAQDALRSPKPSPEHTLIKSNFTQSPSTYWALAVPLLSARYLAEAVNEIFKPKLKFNRQVKGQLEETLSEVSRAELKDTYWALGVGGLMVGVTGYYTVSTYGDMRRQFKDAVGWEFHKEPDKVNFLDMVRSQNTLVRDAARNLASRSTKRLGAHLPFFSFLVPSPFRVNGEKVAMDAWIKKANPITVGGVQYTKLLGPKGSVNAGVGANAFYLASDALGRKRTFYEELQHLIDAKINHKDALGQIITTQDLIGLYDRQMRRNINDTAPKLSSPEWQENIKLFGHMADLMNQTYDNIPKKEYADFTVPKLIYLMGMGLIETGQSEKSTAYVEVANRYGIPAVQKIEADIRNGIDLKAALAEFPAALPAIERTEAKLQPSAAVPELEAAPATKTFANESLKKARPEAPLATHAERAAQATGAAAGLSA